MFYSIKQDTLHPYWRASLLRLSSCEMSRSNKSISPTLSLSCEDESLLRGRSSMTLSSSSSDDTSGSSCLCLNMYTWPSALACTSTGAWKAWGRESPRLITATRPISRRIICKASSVCIYSTFNFKGLGWAFFYGMKLFIKQRLIKMWQ